MKKENQVQIRVVLMVSLLLSCSMHFLFGQINHDFSPLVCKGPIPHDITSRTLVKYEEDVKRLIYHSDSKKIKKVKRDFLLESNYYLDELLTSGKVLFGDTVTNYINKIADKLLFDEPELRKKLRFYTLKTDVTNAFATDQGIIFMTLGLLSQIENETQLALVLAHEIHHFEAKHGISKSIMSDSLRKGKGKKQYFEGVNEAILMLSSFSQQYELDADENAVRRIGKCGYDVNAAKNMFTVLEYSHLPFEEKPFRYDYFESENFKIRKNLRLDELKQITFDLDDSDEYSSHPNLDLRRERFDSVQVQENLHSGEVYFFGEETFKYIRNICRHEVADLNVSEYEFAKAIHNAQIVLDDFPENHAMEKNILQAIYGVAKFKSEYDYPNEDGTEYYGYEQEGEISAAYNFVDQLNDTNALALTLRMGWDLYQKKSDSLVKKIIEDVSRQLGQQKNVKFTDFYREPIDPLVAYTRDSLIAVQKQDSLKAIEEELERKEMEELALDSVSFGANADSLITSIPDTLKLETPPRDSIYLPTGKYLKLANLKAESSKNGGLSEEERRLKIINYPNYKEFLIDLKDLEGLQNLYDSINPLDSLGNPKSKVPLVVNQEQFDLAFKDSDYSDYFNFVNEDEPGDMNINEKIDKIYFVEPKYYVINRSTGIDFRLSEEKTAEFMNEISTLSNKVDLDAQIVSVKLLGTNDVMKYNEINHLTNWFAESIFIDEYDESMGFVSRATENIKEVETIGDVQYVAFTGVWLYKERRRFFGDGRLIPLLFPYTTPIALGSKLFNSYYTYYQTNIYNIKSGELIREQIYEIKGKGDIPLLKSYIHEVVTQIKSSE